MKVYEVGIYYQPYSGGLRRLVHPQGGITDAMTVESIAMTVESIRDGIVATRSFHVDRNKHGGTGDYEGPTGTMWNIEDALIMEVHAVLS